MAFTPEVERTIRISTKVDKESIGEATSTLNEFYTKYNNKSLQIDTKDFNKAISATKKLQEVLADTQKNSPHMTGIIDTMKKDLDAASAYFKNTMAHFTDGSTVKGLDNILGKVSEGYSIRVADLGDYVSTLRDNAHQFTSELQEIGAMVTNWNGKLRFNVDSLNVVQLEQTIQKMKELLAVQQKMDDFNGTPMESQQFESNFNVSGLASRIKSFEEDLAQLKELNKDLNVETINQLHVRQDIQDQLDSTSGYDNESINYIKENINQEQEAYARALSNLKGYVESRTYLLETLNSNSNLFTYDELSQGINTLENDIAEAKAQLSSLQEVNVSGGGGNTELVNGDYNQLIEILKQIKNLIVDINSSFQNISDNELTSEVASFSSLSQTLANIVEYINQKNSGLETEGQLVSTALQPELTTLTNIASQLQTIKNTIATLGTINIMNIDGGTSENLGALLQQIGGLQTNSNLQAMKQQMLAAREMQEHLRVLYDEAGTTLQLLGSKGQVDLVLEYAKQLQELDISNINKSVKNANTDMKLASVLAEMQDYIDKLIKINELRNQYDLGGWTDSFVSKQQASVQNDVEVHQQNTQAIKQETEARKELNATSQQDSNAQENAEIQQMTLLKNAIGEVSKAIGRKNAGFVKEGEIVGQTVSGELIELQKIVDLINQGILTSLTNIKTEFVKAFDLSRIDINNVQAILDEIYSKFVTLKDKVTTLDFTIQPEAKSPTVEESATSSADSVKQEVQSAEDAAKQFVDAAKAKTEFVKANKKVASSAKESTKEVEKEGKVAEQTKKAMDAATSSAKSVDGKWDRTSQIQTDYGEDPIYASKTRTDKTTRSFQTITERWSAIRDEDGELTGEMQLDTVTIIDDYKKRTEAITKENEKIKTAQALLTKFMAQFDSKTMGMGRYIEGYNELSQTTIGSVTDIDTVLIKMQNLDAEYNRLTQLARKGMSSLNPFTNAINDASKITHTFEAVELQFKSVVEPSDELNKNFQRLRDLSSEIDLQKIQLDAGGMNLASFEAFIKNLGEFRETKSKVESEVRNTLSATKNQNNLFNQLVKEIQKRDDAALKAAQYSEGSDWRNYYAEQVAFHGNTAATLQASLSDTLSQEQESQLIALVEKHALLIRDITTENTLIEEQKQKYQQLDSLVAERNDKQNKLNSGYYGSILAPHIQNDIIPNLDSQINQIIGELNKSLDGLAIGDKIKTQFSDIDLVIKKWREQGLVTDEVRQKVDELSVSLFGVTNTSEFSAWQAEWKQLANVVAGVQIDNKVEDFNIKLDKQLQVLINLREQWRRQGIDINLVDQEIDKLVDSLSKVQNSRGLSKWTNQLSAARTEMSLLKEENDKNNAANREQARQYIELVKLRNSYKTKALKEDPDSKMQLFYKKQEQEIQEKINKLNKNVNLTQQEKNELLDIEAKKQKLISEINEKRAAAEDKKKNFVSQDEKIQDLFASGYLGEDRLQQWEEIISKYRQYLTLPQDQQNSEQLQEYQKELTQLYNTYVKLGNASKTFFAKNNMEMLGSLKPNEMNDMQQALQNLYDTQKKIAQEQGFTVALKSINATAGMATYVIDQGAGAVETWTIKVDQATGSVGKFKGRVVEALTPLQRLGKSLGQTFSGLLTSFVGGSAIYKFAGYIKQGVQSVRDLDLAMTELRKVTDETEETYDRFLDTASSMASRIGSTMRDVVSSTADFARLGYSMQEATTMAESAQVLLNVSEYTDISNATDSLISAMQAFSYSADESMHVVDILNEIGNNYAISTADLADSLTRSSAALVAAGGTLEEAVALTSAANTIVQNPESVGNALKTVSMRLRGTSAKEIEEAGEETDGLIQSTSKLYSTIKSLTAVGGKEGISILKDDGSYKSTYEILTAIAERWEEITAANNDAALLEAIAGEWSCPYVQKCA